MNKLVFAFVLASSLFVSRGIQAQSTSVCGNFIQSEWMDKISHFEYKGFCFISNLDKEDKKFDYSVALSFDTITRTKSKEKSMEFKGHGKVAILKRAGLVAFILEGFVQFEEFGDTLDNMNDLIPDEAMTMEVRHEPQDAVSLKTASR